MSKKKPPDPNKRRKQNVVKHGGNLPPVLRDPAFLSESDLQRREIFAHAYVATGSLAKAAEQCGYTGTTQSLRKSGYRLYHEPAVKGRIEQIKTDLLEEMQITQRKVIAELSRIGFADIGDIVDDTGNLLPLKQIATNTRRAISSYKVKVTSFGEDGESVEKEVKFESKSAALVKLGQHRGLWQKDEEGGGSINAEDFARALGEGIARVIAGKRTIEHAA